MGREREREMGRERERERERKWKQETIPLACVMDGGAVHSDSSSVDEFSTTKQPRLAH